jgi:hypothetical protein
MKKLITKFQTTGICEVDVNKVVDAWTHKFMISKYHEQYTLIRFGRGQNRAKVEISPKQAMEIIAGAKLLPIKDSLFVHATTYRSESNILSEIERFKEIEKEKISEVRVISSVLSQYKQAHTRNDIRTWNWRRIR